MGLQTETAESAVQHPDSYTSSTHAACTASITLELFQLKVQCLQMPEVWSGLLLHGGPGTTAAVDSGRAVSCQPGESSQLPAGGIHCSAHTYTRSLLT